MPKVEDTSESEPTVEVGNGSHHLRSELDGAVEAILRVGHVDLEQRRGERSALLSVGEHDRRVPHEHLCMDDRAIAIRSTDVLGSFAVEVCLYEVDKALGIPDDDERVDGVVTRRDGRRYRGYVYIKMTKSRVAALTAVDPRNVSSTIKQPIAMGWVQIRPNPADARSLLLSLTPVKYAWWEELQLSLAIERFRFFAALASEELATLESFLRRLESSHFSGSIDQSMCPIGTTSADVI